MNLSVYEKENKKNQTNHKEKFIYKGSVFSFIRNIAHVKEVSKLQELSRESNKLFVFVECESIMLNINYIIR